jgi:hypothetical protein
VRRQRDGRAGGVVAVRLAGRGASAVLGDLVDGVIAVNGLGGDDAARARSALLAAIPAGVLGRAA